MRKHPSLLWILGPPVMIAATFFAYYWRHGWARQWVDERFPWMAENVGRHLAPVVIDLREPAPTPTPLATPAQPDALASPPPAAAAPAFFRADGSVDLAVLGADRAAWPKKVALRRAMEFPAVVGGKVVGKVQAPAGTEANVAAIKDGQLGLEYQGGGGWIAPEETDLAQRLRR